MILNDPAFSLENSERMSFTYGGERPMLKRKMIVFGIAGILAAGSGVAGCSGAGLIPGVSPGSGEAISDVGETSAQDSAASSATGISDNVSGTDSVTVADSADNSAGAGVTGETSAEDNTGANETESASSESGNNVAGVEANYTYTICDGQVEVGLATKVEDYLEKDEESGADVFMAFDLAKDLGWVLIKKSYNVYTFGYDQDRKIARMELESISGQKGVDLMDSVNRKDALTWIQLWNEPADVKANKWYTLQVERHKPGKAAYLIQGKKDCLTFDQIVLITYTFEHKDEMIGGKLDIFEDFLSGFRVESADETSIIYGI